MMQLRLILLFVVSLLLGFQTGIKAQEIDRAGSEINIKKMRLPLPEYAKNSKLYTIEDEIANLITDILERIGLHDVLAGIELDSTLLNKNSTTKKYTIINFKELNGIREAIVVSAVKISQFNVEQEKEKPYFTLERSIFENNPKEKNQADSTNINTEIYVLLNFFDIEPENYLGFIEVVATHTGGNPVKSKKNALNDLWGKLMMELKKIYWLSSDIDSTTNGKIKLSFGTNYGLKKGMLFELVEPERIWEDEEGEYIVPGGCVGFASVVDTASDSSSLKIIRLWQDYFPESWVVEYPYAIHSLQMNFEPPMTKNYINFGFYLHARAIQNFAWGWGIKIIQITDTLGDNDFGFGFAGFGIWRFLNMSRFDIGTKFGIDVDIPFKKDDRGQTVNAVLFSTQIGFISEIPLSEKSDFVFSIGYRFGVKTKEWEFSEDDQTFSAYWLNDLPIIDNSGFILSVGFKYFLY